MVHFENPLNVQEIPLDGLERTLDISFKEGTLKQRKTDVAVALAKLLGAKKFFGYHVAMPTLSLDEIGQKLESVGINIPAADFVRMQLPKEGGAYYSFEKAVGGRGNKLLHKQNSPLYKLQYGFDFD